MATHRAWVLHAAGQPLVLETRETPEARPGEARVRLQCAALNHRDLWIRKGKYAGIALPCVLGSDGYGMVEAVGSATDAAWVGAAVVLLPSLNWGESDLAPGPNFRILGMPEDGTFSECVCLPVAQLFQAPLGWTPEEAAALPLAGVTAYRALFRRGKLAAGQKVLITGIGGGAAQFLLQFSVAAGAEVWVTSGTAVKIEAACKQGAKGGAIYTEAAWADELEKQAGFFDLCVDSASGPGWASICKLLRPGGRLVFFGATQGVPEIPMRKAFFNQLSFLGTAMGSPRDFQGMLDFTRAHKIHPVIDATFPFENAEEAFQRMDRGLQNGKIILHIG